jgi:hypothetical protein
MKPAIIAILCCCTFAVGQSASRKKLRHVSRISDAYAKAALVALKAIEGDGSSPEVRQGDVYANRRTLDKINAADAEAISPAESNLTDALNKLYEDKLINNAERNIRESIHEIDDKSGNELSRKMHVNQAMSTDPEIMDITKGENVCFSQFEASLRSRSTMIPQACESIASKAKEYFSPRK